MDNLISRQAVLDVTWEEPSYTDALNVLTEVRDKIKALPPVNPQKPKSECEHDHEILKAHSDGANEVLAIIRAEIDEEYDRVHPYDISCAEGLEMALNIVDKFIAEGSGEE